MRFSRHLLFYFHKRLLNNTLEIVYKAARAAAFFHNNICANF